MLPWKSIIKIDTERQRPIYIQIADCIIEEILAGRLLSSQKIPGTRQLSQDLELNRKTVALAYDELVSQGWVYILPSKGAFVGESLPLVRQKNLKEGKDTIDSDFILSIPSLPIRYKDQPNLLENRIDDGSPDHRMAPMEALLKAARFHSKGRLGKHILLNRDPLGEPNLRNTLTHYLANTRAIQANADQILITRGSQMALFLVFNLIIQKGDRVIVSQLSYQSANLAIEHQGGQLMTVEMESDGISVDSIEAICLNQTIRAVYITPHHHFPTTITMSVEKRMRLLELSRKYNFAIVEDDYDYDYHYHGSPILPLASLDKTSNVIYIGSFGKMLAPSVRIGYMYGHRQIVEQCSHLRHLIDKVGDPLMERALAQLIEDNELQRCMKKSVNAYRVRRDLFCSLLSNELGEFVDFQTPDGGMAIWAQWKKGIQVKDLVKLCKKNSLSLDVDFDLCDNACRLGFASMNEGEIVQNVSILKQVLVQHYS